MKGILENKALIIIIVVAVAGGAWFWLSGSDSEEDLLLSTSSTGEAGSVEEEMLASLLELRSIRLDGQIFSNPAFASLRDRGTEIVGEPIGRENPFAPFEAPSRTRNTSDVEGAE